MKETTKHIFCDKYFMTLKTWCNNALWGKKCLLCLCFIGHIPLLRGGGEKNFTQCYIFTHTNYTQRDFKHFFKGNEFELRNVCDL
jgi:hypothetical protein